MSTTKVRTATDPRISRRRRAVAKARTRRLAAVGAAVVTLGMIAWTAFASPLLGIDEIKVVGAKHTTAADVARTAGLETGDNLLLISTGAVADAAETLPWVKAADVDRIMPGTVRIRVTERVPAMVLSVGAARWTIDSSGHVLAVGAAERGLAVISAADAGDIEVGATLTEPELVDALRAYRSLSRGVRRQITGILAPTSERISFSMEDGTLIRFGAAERLPAKNEVLDALLADIRREKRAVAYIDVRVPTSPAVAPRAGVVAPAATPSP